MKKILTIMILAMMVFSIIPFVVAEEREPISVGASISPRLSVGDVDGDDDSDNDEGDDDSSDTGASGGGGGGGGSAAIRARLQEHKEESDDENKGEEKQEREEFSRRFASLSPKFSLWRVEKIISKDIDGKELVEGLTDDAAKIFMRLPRADQKRILEMAHEQAQEKLGEYHLKAVEKQLMYKARSIPVNLMTQAREKLQESKGDYEKIKGELTEEKGKFERAKLGRDEEQATEHAKSYMIKTADLVIKALERVKYNFESNEQLSEEEVADILLKIEESIQEMEDAKADVEAAETKQEVLDAGKVILNAWKHTRLKINRYAALLIHAKVGETVKRSEALENKLDCTLQNMEEQEIVIEDIDAKVFEFSEEIYNADEKHKQAREFLGSSDEEDIDAAKALMEESKAHLVNAHELLKQIVREIKAAGGEIIECDEPELEDDEAYVIEEGEEETENKLEELCVDNEGTWLEEYFECEYLSQELCEENDGVFNECASACRHSTEPNTICTMQCVLVCEFEA